MCLCYIQKKLRRDGPLDLAIQDIKLDETIRAAATQTDQFLHLATLSSAIIVFGTKHGQTPVTKQGYAMHGVALKRLNQALSDADRCTSDEVLLSVAAFAILECLVPTGPKNYLQHMIGLERLFELRDPSANHSSKSALIYHSVRHMLLFASLRTGKPSVLARKEWKAVLRLECPYYTQHEQDLYDILADCTVLVSEHNQLKRSDLEGSGQQNLTQRKALELLNTLREWRERWNADAADAASVVLSTQEFTSDYITPFFTVYNFSSESVAVAVMLYYSALIYVLRVLASLTSEGDNMEISLSFLSTHFQDVEDSQIISNQSNMGLVTAERLAALEICRCIPYYANQKSRSDFSPVLHWAVTTAWMTLKGNRSIEGRWMMDLLNRGNLEFIAKGVWST
jgi:hypothetical protein